MKELRKPDKIAGRGVHKKDALAFGVFVLLFILLLGVLDVLFYNDAEVCTVWETIERGEGPEILIMGNSHAFTVYVPDIITASTGLSCGILGSGAENMDLTLENFKTVLSYYTPGVVVLEANSVIAVSRVTNQTKRQNAIYQDIDGMRSPIDRIRSACNVLRLNDVPFAVSQLFRPEFTWSRWEQLKAFWEDPPVTNRYSPDMNGYRFLNTYTGGTVVPGEIEDAVLSLYSSVTEKQIFDPVNEAALISFLELAQERQIPVLILKSPTLDVSQSTVQGMNRIAEIAAGYSCCQLVQNFHLFIQEIGLERDDFYDVGHMNRRGAVKFTTWFLEQEFLPDQPEPDYGTVFAYRTEEVEHMYGSGGWYCYRMENFDKNTKYRFRLGSKIIKDWSLENFCEVELDPSEAGRLYCDMLPSHFTKDTRDIVQLSLPFMKQNSSEVNSP